MLNLQGELSAAGFTYAFVNRGYAGLTVNAETYPELKKLLAENPDFLKELMPWELESLAFEFHVYAAATPMTAEKYVAYRSERAREARTEILADPDAPAALVLAAADEEAWTAGWLAALRDAELLRPQDEPPGIRETPRFASLMAVVTAGMLGTAAGAEVVAEENLVDFFAKVRQWYGHTPDAFGSTAVPEARQFDLHLSSPTHFEVSTTQVGQRDLSGKVDPADPSLGDYFSLAGASSASVQLAGPSGVGDENVVPARTPLPYVLSMTNPTDAGRAVASIRVVQQLDPNLDVRSFRLGDVVLGDLRVHIPSDRASFGGQFDFLDQRGFMLSVTAGVDVVTRTAVWVFTAVDPETGLAATDPTLGLLRPGQSGSLGYTIRANPQSTTGAKIRAEARVFFDGDAPRITNALTNVLDAVAPTTTFAVTDLGNGALLLSWSAVDDHGGSGVKDFVVYAAIDDGPMSIYRARLTDTSLVYVAQEGQRVEFLVLACDRAGNVEQAPQG